MDDMSFLRVKGYSRAARKQANWWYVQCGQHDHLYLLMPNKRKYNDITTDTWTTPYNLSDAGVERISDLFNRYVADGWKLAPKGSFISGKVGPSVFGLPKEDADYLAIEIFKIWKNRENKMRVSSVEFKNTRLT